MQIDIRNNFPEVQRYIESVGKQAAFAASVALNRSAEWAETDVRREMRKAFDRPTPYFLRSLRIVRSTKQNLRATVWFKENASDAELNTMVMPHIEGGDRRFKPMEMRLYRAGLLPAGWKVVPGEAATLDGFGNMSRGQISQILNVLGTFTEAGYNKANGKTAERLRKGNAKRGQYGFTYFVNRVGNPRGKHLQPGIYKRVYTGFGQAVQPVMVFVRATQYRQRLDFFGIVERRVNAQFPREFEVAFSAALRSASTTAGAGNRLFQVAQANPTWRAGQQ